MRTCERRTLLVLATLLLACTSARGQTHPAPPLKVQIVLDKTEFFEGEPIFAMFELHNVSSDTVRIPRFALSAGWLAGVLRRADGSVVPDRGWLDDYVCPRTSCNEDDVAPGRARYSPFVVQEFWGEEGPLSQPARYNDLKTGDYALAGSFELDGPPGSTRVVASPVVFRIRPRRPAEDTTYQQFVRLRTIDAPKWRVAELDSAVAWMSRRLAADRADPFALKMLMWSDAQSWAAGMPIDSTAAVRMFRLKLLVADARARSPIGALAVVYLYAAGPLRYGDPRLPLCSTLSGTPAGEIACEREAWLARERKARPPP